MYWWGFYIKMTEAKCEDCGAIYLINEHVPTSFKCICRCTKYKKVK